MILYFVRVWPNVFEYIHIQRVHESSFTIIITYLNINIYYIGRYIFIHRRINYYIIIITILVRTTHRHATRCSIVSYILDIRMVYIILGTIIY